MPLLRNLGAENNVTEVVSIFPYTDLQSFSKVGFHSLKHFGLNFIDRLPNRGLQFLKQILSVSENMAYSRKERIEILCLDAAEQTFCSFCTNLNISNVTRFKY